MRGAAPVPPAHAAVALPAAAWWDEAAFGAAFGALFGVGGVVASARAEAGLAFHPSAAQQYLADRYARAAWRGLPHRLTRRRPVRGRVTMIEGATGTGKTLAYLLPAAVAALASGRPGVVATNTLALQRQILGDEAAVTSAAVRMLTGRTLRVAALQGLGNYVSLSAVETLAASGHGAERQTAALLHDLAAWTREALEGRASGVLRDFLDDRGLERLPGGLAARGLCLDGASPPEERAAYLRQREAADGAHVVLVTHAWLLSSLRYARPLLPPPEFGKDDRACGVCVCDEAHLLPAAAEDALSADVSVSAVERRLADAAAFAGDGRHRRLRAALSDADRALAELWAGAAVLRDALPGLQASWAEAARARPRESAAFVDAASEASDAAGAVAEALRGLGDPRAQLLAQDLRADQAQIGHFIDAVRWHEGGDRFRSFTAGLSWSPVRGLPRLHLTPHFPGRLVARLWDERHDRGPLVDSLAMTSATLRTPGTARGGGFEVALNEISAFGEARTANADLNCSVEPEQFGTVRFVLSNPASTPPVRTRAAAEEDDGEGSASNPAWWGHAGAMTAAAWATLRLARTRTCPEPVELPPNVLVLTTSYGDAEGIGEAVAGTWRAAGQRFTSGDEPPLPGAPVLLVHRRGTPLSELVSAFRARARRRVSGDEGGSVLVTPAGWEGLDLPGLVHHNVIARLPWPPPPSEAEIQALAERIGGRDRALAVLIGTRRSRMLRKLRQGIGRGIRSPRDDCTVWFADPRVPPLARHAGFDPGVRDTPGTASDAPLAIPARFANAYATAALWPPSAPAYPAR